MTKPIWNPLNRVPTTSRALSGPFINELQQDIDTLNILISRYNEAPTQKEKLGLLRGIYFESSQINARYPQPLLERHHGGYQGFLDSLPSQFKSLDIDSLEPEDALLPLKAANTALLNEIRVNYVHPNINLMHYVNDQRERINTASSIVELTQLQQALELRKLQEYGRKECHELLKEIQYLQFGAQDQLFYQFLNNQKIELNSSIYRARTTADIDKIKLDVQILVKKYTSVMVTELKSVIDEFRQKASPFTQGMKHKAQQIEEAMQKVPISDRIDFMNKRSARPVQEALAAHRTPAKKGIELMPDGQIDPQKASKTYQAFSAKFFATKYFDNDDDDSDDELRPEL